MQTNQTLNQLRSQDEIIAGWEGCITQPLVSICCLTYNHENFIEDALEGFLRQETNFPLEILVHDDASEDNTPSLLELYEQKYPKIIKVIYQKENQLSKGVDVGVEFLLKRVKGQYVAPCDGDDYWTSVDKLQKQVELLIRYPIAVACVAGAKICKQDRRDEFTFLRETGAGISGLLSFEGLDKNYFHTSTYLIRADIYEGVVSDYFSGDTMFGDSALSSILISLGPFIAYSEVVSVYRVTGTGIWTGLDSEKQLLWECKVAKKLSRLLDGKHARRQKLILFLKERDLVSIYLKQGRVKDVLRQLPGLFQNSWIYLPHLVAVKSKAWLSKRDSLSEG